MPTRIGRIALLAACLIFAAGCATQSIPSGDKLASLDLDADSRIDAQLQAGLDRIDTALRNRLGMAPEQTAAGLLDLRHGRMAMIHPDHMDYAASLPKIGILLAYFQDHPGASHNLEANTRHELGLMIKASSNEMATKYSSQLGLKRIQEVLNSYQLYDTNRGGIWMGKHYGRGNERRGDPIGNHSHAATIRQLLRFYLMLEQGRLVSPAASKIMREIFASPGVPHDSNKFVQGLANRNVQILRKSGTWENWLHDTAVVTGAGRHYVLVAMTRHPRGDEYLVDLAASVDDLMAENAPP